MAPRAKNDPWFRNGARAVAPVACVFKSCEKSCERPKVNDRAIIAKLEVENRRLRALIEEQAREISDSHMATIFALAKLAESRDDDTGKHLERVQQYCRSLALELQEREVYSDVLTAGYIENLFHACALHDIGKVGISDSILLKPGKLTNDEFAIMTRHTLIGAQTLRTALERNPRNEFIKMGIEVAAYHHERWDGTGYPERLSGDAIPYCARIMAVADVYDALRARRCYKEPFTHENASRIILAGNGKQFDPAIVEAFSALQDDFRQIRDSCGD